MSISKFASCALLLLLCACGSSNINVSSKPIEIAIGQAADPAAVTMLPVNLRVITKENYESFLAELAKMQGNSPVFIAMTVRDYENMALNLADLRRYIEQQKSMISYYRHMSEKETSPQN